MVLIVHVVKILNYEKIAPATSMRRRRRVFALRGTMASLARMPASFSHPPTVPRCHRQGLR
eukprot:6206095-Pleurochrysis_carterae.AAC.2